jgi:hypothetical protein
MMPRNNLAKRDLFGCGTFIGGNLIDLASQVISAGEWVYY